MKTKFYSLFTVLAFLIGFQEAAGQTAQFFRIVGSTVTKITKFRADGTLVWSNAVAGTNYTVQMATSLSGGGNWVGYNQFYATNGINTNQLNYFPPLAGMAFIPAGSFTMGDTLDGESDALPTNVTVSAFYMDVNLVSSNQWLGVYSYATSHGYSFFQGDAGNTYAAAGKAANHPVQTVDWFDCVKWSNARSAQTGLTPVYYTDAGFTRVFTNGDNGTTVYANWGANGYRLPTEAEWEKAARGGLSGLRFPWGNTISESQANYSASPGSPSYDLGPYSGFNTNFNTGGYPYTSPVGYFSPNGYGLYDMEGNALGWCWDWYAAPPYPAGSAYLGGINPTGAATGSVRVLRGSSWGSVASYSRCAFRNSTSPINPVIVIGFRCVRGL